MPVLSNPKHERFAQELAKGKTADEAYELAGYNRHEGNASRLRGNEKVVARVAELQEPAARRARITAQRLMEMAETVFDRALEAGQNAAAVAAIKEMGVLSGERIEKREQGGPGEFERMDADELRDFLRAEAAALRLGDGDASDQGRSGSILPKSGGVH